MFFTLIWDYLVWHYRTALIAYIRTLKNIWWFLHLFFTPGDLLLLPLHTHWSQTSFITNILRVTIEISTRVFALIFYSLGLGLLILLGVGFYSVWVLLPIFIIASGVVGALLVSNSLILI